MKLQVTGNYSDVKGRMDFLKKEAQKEKRSIEREIAKKEKEALFTDNLKKQLEQVQKEIIKYSLSKTQPVLIDEVLVDAIILKRFLNKLKGFHINIVSEGASVILYYEKDPVSRGKLELYDLSRHYMGMKDKFPKAVIVE